MIEKGFWVAASLLFAFLLSQGNWFGAAVVLGSLLVFAALTAGLYPMAILLLVGPATFFVFLNSFLNAIPFVTMERLIFISMLGIILLKVCFKKDRRVKWAPAEIAMICFLIVSLLSLLTTFNDKPFSVWLSRSVALYAQGYFMPMVSFMIARRLIWHEKDIESLFKIFVAVGAFLGCTAILQLYFGVSLFMPDYMTLIHHSEDRAVGTFANASEYGLAMSVFILIGVLVYTRTRDTIAKGMLLGCLALMITGLILCKTRAPWLGALFSLAFVSIYDKRVQPLLIILTGFVLLTSAIALPLLMDIDSFISRIMDVDPILGRLAIWAIGLNMMIQNPILGIGFGKDSFGDSIHDYAINVGPISAQWAITIGFPHNEFLFIAALTGIVGIMIYLSIFWHIFRMLQNTYKDPSSSSLEKDTALYMGGVLICFVVNGLFVDLGIFIYCLILMYFLFGIVAAFNLKNKAHQGTSEPSKPVEMAT